MASTEARDLIPPTPARVLLAEDDAELRALIALTLRAAGFLVVEASDGLSLLDHITDTIQPGGALEAFDVIVSDIQMPRFSALDVMFGARSLLDATPVVLITAFGDTRTHQRAARLGATMVLDKPLKLDDLCRTVCRVLSRPKGSRSFAQ